jgi:sulfite reductase (NADPH) hemoprotein beta-component
MISETEVGKPLSEVEGIKSASNFLRGTLVQGLQDSSTGAISSEDAQLVKFHGLYLQDDRDQRIERRKAKLERAFSFMIRVRVPGGVATPQQYITMDELADRYANGTIRLTTRQAFQLHGLLKGNAKPLIKEMSRVCLDSIAACGDVNRNVMCNPNPKVSGIHQEVFAVSKAISEHLLPRSRAYYEVWLDEEKVAGSEPEAEPIYGETFLPRKFKIGIAVPPSNDIDVFSQDLGFIAIVEEGKLAGFNVTAGGGLGRSHGNADTFARIADVIGFCKPEEAVAVAEAVVTTQRDFGDRTNRKHARLKYTIQDRGLDWFIGEVQSRLGWALEEPRPFSFTSQADDYGWHRDVDGDWYFNLFILSGRIRDTETEKTKTALREIAETHDGEFRLTANQNLMISGVSEERKVEIEAILGKYGLSGAHHQSGLRLNSLACPSMPTCPLGLAESERAMPEILEKLEQVVERAGLRDDAITIRMTGCPNGCARPYMAEIGLVGKSPGKYNLYLGAGFDGRRLNTEVASSMTVDEMVERLAPLITRYAQEREQGERFGDFCHRIGAVAPAG